MTLMELVTLPGLGITLYTDGTWRQTESGEAFMAGGGAAGRSHKDQMRPGKEKSAPVKPAKEKKAGDKPC